MARSWITPKTDWARTDKVEYSDYNRIRNNLLYINDTLNEMYPDKAQTLDLGDALTYSANYLPSQFNAFEDALESFTRIGFNMNIGTKKTYAGNTPFITNQELNRIESCCLRWYNLNPPITDVTISPSLFDLSAGETQQLSLTVIPTESIYTVEWSSSNTAVMTVDSNGVVTAVNTGTATITASIIQSNQIVATVSSVGACIIPVQSISLSDVSLEGCNGQTLTATVIVTPSNATHKNDYVASDRDTTATTTTKSGMTIRVQLHNNFDDGYETYYTVKEATKYVDVSLDGYSTTLEITIKQGGTIREDIRYFHQFEVIQKGSSASSNVTLLLGNVDNSLKGAIDNVDDSYCSYRTVIDTHISTHFSSNMSNAIKSFNKSVFTSTLGISTTYKKVHLLAYSEVGEATYTYTPILILGTDNYQFIMDRGFISAVYPSVSLALSRSRFRESGKAYVLAMDNNYVNRDDYQVGAEIPDSTQFPIGFMLYQISGTTRVKPLNEKVSFSGYEYSVYEIDWTNNTSNPRIFDIPLGSVVLDRSGVRN